MAQPSKPTRTVLLSLAAASIAACTAVATGEDDAESGEEAIRTYFSQHAAKAPSLPRSYEAQSGRQKQAILTGWLMETEYCGEPGNTNNGMTARDYRSMGCRLFSGMPQGFFDAKGGLRFGWHVVSGFFKRDNLTVTFDRSQDEMPEGRYRVIHPIGSVVALDLTITGGTYSGILGKSSGATPVPAVARLSLAGLSPNVAPGIAVKFFVDGKPSVNSIAMYSLTGQFTASGKADYNFFRNGFTNIIDTPNSAILKPAVEAFAAVKADPFALPVQHLASINADGSAVPASAVRAPVLIMYKPNPQLTAYFDEFSNDDTTKDFRTILRDIPPGTELYTLWASDSRDKAGLVKIGSLTSKTYIAATQRGDEQVFFQHAR